MTLSETALTFTTDDIDTFLKTVYFDDILRNGGGMNINDMFSFSFLLKKLQPKCIIESGIWNGNSTKLIRRTLGEDVQILCLDPRDIPASGFKDTNPNTRYMTGKSFVDFKEFPMDSFDMETTLCFFDDHQNSAQRILQCIEKGVKHVFFNDNYPVNAGSHYTIQHLKDVDTRKRFDLANQYRYSINTLPQIDMSKRESILSRIGTYVVFPNVFPSDIKLFEGTFTSKGFFSQDDTDARKKYSMFYEKRGDYCWNTYLTLV